MGNVSKTLNSVNQEPTNSSRLKEFDYEHSAFGDEFSDHMISAIWRDGVWSDFEIICYGNISLPPTSIAIQYAQTVFEGMKAYRGLDNLVRLFRPEVNAQRFRKSALRLCIPPIDNKLFVKAIEALVRRDIEWVPSEKGSALYIRPLLFSTEGHIGVRPSREYRFIIVSTPVKRYFSNQDSGLKLLVESSYTRVAPFGGLGAAKTAANYAGSILSGELAKEQGFDQVLWLDGAAQKYIEEAGLMNVFFRFGDEWVTPVLGDSILPGVTRDSLIVLLRDQGLKVQERRISIEEVVKAANAGDLKEMFACGTAAVVAPIAELAIDGRTYRPGCDIPGKITAKLYEQLIGIQHGELNDRWGWTKVVMDE